MSSLTDTDLLRRGLLNSVMLHRHLAAVVGFAILLGVLAAAGVWAGLHGNLVGAAGLAGASGVLAALLWRAVRSLARAASVRDLDEQAQWESSAWFRRLAEHIADVFWMSNPVRRQVLYVSSAYEQIWGRPRASLYADFSQWIDAIHPVDQERMRQASCTRALTGEYDQEYRVVRPNGTIRWIHDRSFLIRDRDGTAQRIVGLAQDITERKHIEVDLRETNQMLHAPVHASPLAIIALDPEARVVLWNPAAERMFGWSAQEVMGRVIPTIPETDQARFRAVLADSLCGLTPADLETPCRRKDGSLFDASLWTVPLRDATGALYASMAVIADATERKWAADALRQAIEAEQRARQLADVLRSANLALTYSFDLDTILAELLTYLEQLVPYDSANVMLLGSDDYLIVRAARGYERWTDPTVTRSVVFHVPSQGILSGLLVGRSVLIPDTRQHPGWTRIAGAEHVLSWFGVPLLVNGTLIGTYSVDKVEAGFFTEEHMRRAETLAAQAAVAIQNAMLFDEVRAGHQRLALLSRRLVTVQETERAHFARELHDEIGQALTGLKLILDMASRPPQNQLLERQRASLSEARAIVDELMAHVSEFSLDLHPPILNDLGLLSALLWYTNRYTIQTSIQVDLRHSGLEQRFAPEIEIVIFRVVQESLTNIARHAGADSATVQLLADQGMLTVRVADQGQGFDPAALPVGASSGLRGMRERVALVGGRLTIEAAPGRGTCLIAELPIDTPVERLQERYV